VAIKPDEITAAVLNAVGNERVRQFKKLEAGMSWDCADPNVPNYEKAVVLGEEYGEVCKAVLEDSNLYVECIHVAAVAVAMAESIRRKEQ
jgi:hypothetical protein